MPVAELLNQISDWERKEGRAMIILAVVVVWAALIFIGVCAVSRLSNKNRQRKES